MLTVHHLENSRSQRVLWLLEELELPYKVQLYKRNPQTMLAPPELRAVHPLGKSPVITDDGITIAETGAIVEYLCDKAGGKLRPEAGSAAARAFTFWLHYAEGSAMTPLLMTLVFSTMPKRAPALMRGLVGSITGRAQTGFVNPQLKNHFNFIEGELAATGWFAGAEFTAADVMMSFPLEAGASRARAFARKPHILTFLEKIHARPAYQRALVQGGPYIYA